jgi:chromosome partitioning protein
VKTIALIAQKGGVGKTTMAVNLAVTTGLRTVLFDLDPQESAVMWADRRQSDSPHVEFLTERRLVDGLKAAEQGGYDVAIIDTPPAAGPQAFTAAQAANLVLIPCRPSLVDLDAIRRTATLIKSANVPAFVVFNAAPHSATTLLEDASAIADGAGLSACPIILRERSAYKACWPMGKTVIEAEPDSKAAQEIIELKDWVLAQLQVCTPEVMQKQPEESESQEEVAVP